MVQTFLRLRWMGMVLVFFIFTLSAVYGGTASYRYFRFVPTKLRGGDERLGVKLSEFQLLYAGIPVAVANASNPGGNTPMGMGPEMAVDGLTSTSWVDLAAGPLILDYGTTVTVDGYRWATVVDSLESDPVRWLLEGSDDSEIWQLVDDRATSDQVVTVDRMAFLPSFNLNQQIAGDVVFETPAQSFVDEIQVILSTESDEAEIRYTLNGTIPDQESQLYSGEIQLVDSSRITARAFEAGLDSGEVRVEAYIKTSSAVAERTSNLPVIILENFDRGPVPNEADLQEAYLTLFEPDLNTGRTGLSSLPTKANRVGIKRRGSSTLNDPKGNYRVEFWEDDSEEAKDLRLLGMSDHDEWILFAPYKFDRSLVRIPFLFGMSNDIGSYAPKGRFVEVYLNTEGDVDESDYQGVYVLLERISRGKDRVEIDRLDEDDTSGEQLTGGYILSIDRLDEGDLGFRSARGFPKLPPGTVVHPWYTYVYPKEQNIVAEQEDYIRTYVDDFESALFRSTYRDPEIGYRAWFDVETSIDFHIVTAFSKDPDALRLSTYLFKPRDGKLAFGPLWDKDRTMGCDGDERSKDPEGWQGERDSTRFFEYDYWGRLFRDKDFMQSWIDRWQELRQAEFANVAMTNRIDALAAEVSESQPRNENRWPEVAPNGGEFSELDGWHGEIEHLKNWAVQRAEWIDSQFIAPPLLQEGGVVVAGTEISAEAEDGTLYYTTDGSDPRMVGGGIRGNAIAIADPERLIVIDQTSVITARARLGLSWSGVVRESFVVGAVADEGNFVVSEIMYHPHDAFPDEIAQGITKESDFEYVEIQNISDHAISLLGVTVEDAFDFAFDDSGVSEIQPGSVVILARNRLAFEERYGTQYRIAGEFGSDGKKLSNKGEILTFKGLDGSVIRSFSYGDDVEAHWPGLPDGSGESLVLRDPLSGPDHGLASSWRASSISLGSPGRRNNSLYSEWKEVLFTPNELLDETVSREDSDPDDDGLSNLLELLLASDPKSKSPEALPKIGVRYVEEGVPEPDWYFTMSVFVRRELMDAIVGMKVSNDLGDWSEFGVLVSQVDQGNGFDKLVLRAPMPVSKATKKFARIEAEVRSE